jgi:hypothetical protein
MKLSINTDAHSDSDMDDALRCVNRAVAGQSDDVINTWA